MTTRSKQSLGGTALVVLAILFVALVVLSATLLKGVRLDLTENRLYTLSEGTRNILEDVDEPINLYFFFSRDAAEADPYLKSYAARTQEMLEEFAARSGGSIRLQVIDPQPFSDEEDRAAAFGLEPRSSRGSTDPIYFGLAGTNATDGLEVVGFFEPEREEFLEYDLARLVWALDNPERPVIGLVSSLPMGRSFDPQRGQPTEPWVVVAQMEQLFEVRDLGATPDAIGEDVDLLMVVHPKELGDAALYAIDQFVMRGGKLLAFVDPNAEMQAPDELAGQSMQMLQARSSDLNKLFEAWGFRSDPAQVVADAAIGLAVTVDRNSAPVRHVAMLGLTSEQMAADEIITAQLDRIYLATAGRLQPKEGAETRFVPLLESSEQSMLMSASRFQFLPDPSVLLNDFERSGKRQVLAARIEGQFSSAFPDGPPEGVEASGEHRAQSGETVSMVAVADTDILSDRMWVEIRQTLFGQSVAQPFAANGAFVVNALETLAGSQDLISVRSRGSFSRPFDRVDQLRRQAEEEYRAQQQRLQRELEETERRLSELQSARQDGEGLLLTSEQETELDRFQQERLRTRKALRDVGHQLNADIDRLGTLLKVINIGAVPLLVALAALAAALWRSGRRRRARGMA